MTDPLECRTRLLDHAKAVVTDRNDTYGDPLADFRRIATMWSALFAIPIDPHQVAMAMACLKLSRMVEAPEQPAALGGPMTTPPVPYGVRSVLHVDNALCALSAMPAESVDLCVTSPPYWGLRSYTSDPAEIGRDSYRKYAEDASRDLATARSERDEARQIARVYCSTYNPSRRLPWEVR